MPLRATPRCLPGAEVQVPARSSSREGAKPGWEDVTHPTALPDLRVHKGRGWAPRAPVKQCQLLRSCFSEPTGNVLQSPEQSWQWCGMGAS